MRWSARDFPLRQCMIALATRHSPLEIVSRCIPFESANVHKFCVISSLFVIIAKREILSFLLCILIYFRVDDAIRVANVSTKCMRWVCTARVLCCCYHRCYWCCWSTKFDLISYKSFILAHKSHGHLFIWFGFFLSARFTVLHCTQYLPLSLFSFPLCGRKFSSSIFPFISICGDQEINRIDSEYCNYYSE